MSSSLAKNRSPSEPLTNGSTGRQAHGKLKFFFESFFGDDHFALDEITRLVDCEIVDLEGACVAGPDAGGEDAGGGCRVGRVAERAMRAGDCSIRRIMNGCR